MYTPNQALRSYQQVGAVSQVAATDDPVRLVQLLLGNAVDRLALARGHVERGEIAAKAEQLSRVVAIVDTLNALVDLEKGGDIGRSLRDLYDYVTRRLTVANLRNDAQALDEVAGLLREIKTGWDGIVAQPRPAAAGAP
jgi:flagellar protein FliS